MVAKEKVVLVLLLLLVMNDDDVHVNNRRDGVVRSTQALSKLGEEVGRREVDEDE